MLLSYNELIVLQETGVIENSDPGHVNGASIDVTLGPVVLCERVAVEHSVVYLKKKAAPRMFQRDISTNGIVLAPGDFILAETEQVFNLPPNVAAEFKLKSSAARAGLQHALAGWCDPGWHGSVLTLELTNATRHHYLHLEAGMKIGQMIFYRVTPVPTEASYAVRGQYNGDKTATASKGLR